METEGPQITSQYGAYALHDGLTRLYARTPMRPGTHMHARTKPSASMHTQTNMQYLLLFHSNNGFANAPQCYVMRTLPVLFIHNLLILLEEVRKSVRALWRKILYI